MTHFKTALIDQADLLTDEFLKANTLSEGSCLIWTGAVVNGRPVTKTANSCDAVHRLLWLKTHGSVPRCLKNKCGNLLCINLDHWAAPTGLHFDPKRGYRIQVRVNGVRHRRGYFQSEGAALDAYETLLAEVGAHITEAGTSRNG